MTTHFMEEADTLGDRICILSKGAIRAIGSSVELKNKFGVGYQLVVLKQDNFDEKSLDELLSANLAASSAVIRKLADNHAEISYQIPFSCVPGFPGLIRQLRAASPKLGVKNFVLQPSTLEEVFLRLAKDDEESGQL